MRIIQEIVLVLSILHPLLMQNEKVRGRAVLEERPSLPHIRLLRGLTFKTRTK